MGFQVIDPQGRLKTFQVPTAFSLTTTGNIDDLDFSNADQIRFNNATLSTLRGLKAGYAGQQVTLVSIGAGQVHLAHQNASSAIGNRLINSVTSGITPLAPGTGYATYQYDAVTLRWRLVSHCQGAGLTPTFAAGDFTGNASMTWTVDSGDVTTRVYYVEGKKLTQQFNVNNSTIGGVVSNHIKMLNPNGYTAAVRVSSACLLIDGGAVVNGYADSNAVASTVVGFYRNDGGNWTLATNTAAVIGSFSFELT